MLNLRLLLRTRPFRITLWIIPEKKHFDAMTKRGVTERLPHVLRPASAVPERHGREHEQQAAEVPAPLNRPDGADKSIFEVDLPTPQRNAA